jgi:hypothetical protein
MDVPQDVIKIIASYITKHKMKLLNWINKDKLDYIELSENQNAIDFLEKNKNYIYWYYLSGNPNAIHILEANPDKIDWIILSRNPNAIHLLKDNQDKINWCFLSSNPSIFEPDINQYYIDLIKKTNIIDNIINSNTKSYKYLSGGLQ